MKGAMERVPFWAICNSSVGCTPTLRSDRPYISFHVSGAFFTSLASVSLEWKLLEGGGCVFTSVAPPSLTQRGRAGTGGESTPGTPGASCRGAQACPAPALRSAPSSRLPGGGSGRLSSLPTWRLFRCARPRRLSGPDAALTSGFPMCLRADISAPTDHARASSLTSRH